MYDERSLINVHIIRSFSMYFFHLCAVLYITADKRVITVRLPNENEPTFLDTSAFKPF